MNKVLGFFKEYWLLVLLIFFIVALIHSHRANVPESVDISECTEPDLRGLNSYDLAKGWLEIRAENETIIWCKVEQWRRR